MSSLRRPSGQFNYFVYYYESIHRFIIIASSSVVCEARKSLWQIRLVTGKIFFFGNLFSKKESEMDEDLKRAIEDLPVGPVRKSSKRPTFGDCEVSVKKCCFLVEPFDVLQNQSPHYLVFPPS
jgi:hypothetical protein